MSLPPNLMGKRSLEEMKMDQEEKEPETMVSTPSVAHPIIHRFLFP